MNKLLLLLLTLSLSPLAHAMRCLPIESTRQSSKRLKIEFILDEEQTARDYLNDHFAGDHTAFHKACLAKNFKDIRMFLTAKTDLYNKDEHGRTPLHYLYSQYTAYLSDNIKITRLLLTRDASGINLQDDYGNTPLHYAALNGALAIVDIFLQFGANPNLKNNEGQSPLHFAIQYQFDYKRRKRIVRKLLDYGANVNAKDRYGATPLHYAAFYGHWVDIIPLLVKAGAQYFFDNNNEGPLQYVFKEELNDAAEEFWVDVISDYDLTRDFDKTFAVLLYAFPGYAGSFTAQDHENAQALLNWHRINAGMDDSELLPDSSSEEESCDTYYDSIKALGRAVEMMDDSFKKMDAVETAGIDLRATMVASVCKRSSIITLLNTRAVTGRLRPNK